uniref:Uncharacterized protein n=1 Tax=Strigamia maritima TaxID=126957 RepID=T1II42_STRMM
MKENKLVILGAGGVGKTSLVMQFVDGIFSFSYKPTVEDYYRHTLQLPNGLFQTMEILDTAGSHHFPAMRELSIRSSRAFVLVFAVDNEQSFHEVVNMWALVKKIKGDADIAVILVGNKVDLEANRQISSESAVKFAKDEMRCSKYLETSAKYNVNVSQLFTELLMRALYGVDGKEEAISQRATRRLSRRLSVLSLRRKHSEGSVDKEPREPASDLQTYPINQIQNKCVIL